MMKGLEEVSLFLTERPDEGLDPTLLTRRDIDLLLLDLRRREQHQLPKRGLDRTGGERRIVTPATRRNYLKSMAGFFGRVGEKGWGRELGLPVEFAIEQEDVPKRMAKQSPRPFSDEVAQALANPASLDLLATLDEADVGARDIWAIQVSAGRRIGEVLQLRWDCLVELDGQPYLYYDPTKVGKLDEAIPIANTELAALVRAGQTKTVKRFEPSSAGRRRTPNATGCRCFPARPTTPD